MKSKRNVLILMAALVGLFIIAGVLYNALSKDFKPKDETGSAAASAAPDFTVYDKDGNTVTLSSFKGTPVVLNFWASWCPPCRNEMPDFQKIYEQYKDQGIAFLFVNMTDGSRETVEIAKSFIKNQGYTFPVYFDEDSAAADAFAISSIPDTFFIDKDGNVIKAYEGMISSDIMLTNIKKLLN